MKYFAVEPRLTFTRYLNYAVWVSLQLQALQACVGVFIQFQRTLSAVIGVEVFQTSVEDLADGLFGR